MNNFGIPNLPSDTLYKFMTFFGLIIFLTSFLTPIISFKDNDLSKFALTLKYKNLERENEYLDKTLSDIDSVMSTNDFKNKMIIYEYPRPDGNSRFDSSRYLSAKVILDKRNSLISVSKIQNDSLLIFKQQLDNSYNLETRVIKYCNLGIPCGIVIALCGFILWFINNQVYQDLFIKLQSGYKIIPATNIPKAKNFKHLSDDELYLKNWKREVTFEIQKTLIVLLLLLVLYVYAFDRYFPNGVFQVKHFEIVSKGK